MIYKTFFIDIDLSLIILWIQIWDNAIVPYPKSQNKYITLRLRVDHQFRLKFRVQDTL